MGTRSIVVLPGMDGETAVLYRQFDGYPDGMGDDLVAILRGRRILNGFRMGDTTATAYNGPDCLSAAIVAGLKAPEGTPEIGSVYLFPAGSRDLGEEYTYTVTVRDDRPYLTVDAGYGSAERRRLFDGFADDWPGGEAVAK
jgi:hypothetical protein